MKANFQSRTSGSFKSEHFMRSYLRTPATDPEVFWDSDAWSFTIAKCVGTMILTYRTILRTLHRNYWGDHENNQSDQGQSKSL